MKKILMKQTRWVRQHSEKEHLKFKEIDEKNRVLEFSFLGKDSVPWQKSLLIDSDDKLLLYNNLSLFTKNKKETISYF